MRRKEREVTDLAVIRKIIENAEYLHLGMMDGEYPYVVPMHFGYQMDGDQLVFYVHCAGEGHKLDCLRENGNVFVGIDRQNALITATEPCAFGSEYESVMCRGKATIIEDPEEKCRALGALMFHISGQEFSFEGHVVQATTIVRIDVETFAAKVCAKQK